MIDAAALTHMNALRWTRSFEPAPRSGRIESTTQFIDKNTTRALVLKVPNFRAYREACHRIPSAG
jgi:hypothetical protein